MTPNEALDKHLTALADSNSVAYRAKVRDLKHYLYISTSVLYDWRRGRSRIKPIYWPKITEILGEDIFADFTNSEK